MMQGDEVLIVGVRDTEDEAGRAELAGWPVLARASDDVVVLRAGAGDLDAIASRARLALHRLPDGSMEVRGDERALDALDDGARLFVEGWRARPVSKPDRPGEGLPWDAPGYRAPCPPTDVDRPARAVSTGRAVFAGSAAPVRRHSRRECHGRRSSVRRGPHSPARRPGRRPARRGRGGQVAAQVFVLDCEDLSERKIACHDIPFCCAGAPARRNLRTPLDRWKPP